MQYDKRTAEALIPSVGINENGMGEVFRLNLELGRFMKGFEVDVGGDDLKTVGAGSLQGGVGAGSVNAAAIADESHGLLAFGTSLGTVEFWDPRCRDRVGLLHPPWTNDLIEDKQEVTALQFHRSGLSLATGSSAGLTHVYDLRTPNPLLKKDQGFGFPIQDLIWLTPTTESHGQLMEPKILSADKRIIKIWDSRNGQPWTSVEPTVDLHAIAWCKNSGMLLTANEGRQQHSFFIPQLGPAPTWCSFLDNLVEEMAEDPNDPNAYASQRSGEVYDNFKFLTHQQLEALNLSYLIGTTSLLRPYMHGFFVAQELYEEAKIIADPYTWEEQRAQQIRSKIESERETRIRGVKKVKAKVNQKLAEKVQEKEAKAQNWQPRDAQSDEDASNEAAKPLADKSKTAPSLLKDPRFTKLFEDEEFAIDESSKEFRARNPGTAAALDRKPRDPAPDQKSSAPRDEAAESSEDDIRDGERPEKPKAKRVARPQMKVSLNGKSQSVKRDRPFGSRRVENARQRTESKPVVGEQQIEFTPARKKKQTFEGETTQEALRKKRRSASGNTMRKL